MKATLRLFAVYFPLSILPFISAAQPQANVTLRFVNEVSKRPLVADSVYANVWNEDFTIHLLKYYISDISLQASDKKISGEPGGCHLINEADSSSKKVGFYVAPGRYNAISFFIGVDSEKNVSGAQTDALDPLNGMFWTWNSGYIMFKLEGNSSQSAVVNNKIEYHIGGFSGVSNTVKKITLQLPDDGIALRSKSVTEVIIGFGIDNIFNGGTPLKIAQTPVCTIPGTLAAGIAANYATAFEIIKIVQH